WFVIPDPYGRPWTGHGQVGRGGHFGQGVDSAGADGEEVTQAPLGPPVGVRAGGLREVPYFNCSVLDLLSKEHLQQGPLLGERLGGRVLHEQEFEFERVGT